MSGGKGGSSTSTVQVPDYINEASEANIALANQIAQLGPIRDYGAKVAGFTPMQQSGFQNTADLASAFGMQAPSDPMSGMPAAQDFGGGIMGYSPANLVDQQLAALAENDPAQAAAIQDLFMRPGGPDGDDGLFPALQRRIG